MKSLSELIESSRRRDKVATREKWKSSLWFESDDGRKSFAICKGTDPICYSDKDDRNLQFLVGAANSEPLFREIAEVAVEALKTCRGYAGEGVYEVAVRASEASRQALSKIQSLIDEAEKK